LEFKQRIIDIYEGLFSTTEKQDTFGNSFGAKWGWYQSIFTVANGCIFDFERATKLRLHEFLMFLEFKVDLANESNKQIKKYE
jgi:hypothetical protein